LTALEKMYIYPTTICTNSNCTIYNWAPCGPHKAQHDREPFTFCQSFSLEMALDSSTLQQWNVTLTSRLYETFGPAQPITASS